MLSTLIFHQFSLIFTHFYSFSVVCCQLSRCRLFLGEFSCPWTPPRTLSLIFTHFYSFLLILRCLLSVVTLSTFFREVYLSLDTPSDIFTHFYSFPQFHTCFSSIFTHFYSFLLISTVSHLFFIDFHSFSLILRCLLSVVTLSTFFREVYLSLDTPSDIFQNTWKTVNFK